jgi:cytochrome c biogenesis protein
VGVLGWVRWAWRQLTSMRTALFLLLLLAIAAVPGSVFPQRRIDAAAVTSYLAAHRASGPWLDRIGAFDVYSSAWFSAIYLLLFISLVGCVLPRSRQHWRAARAAPPRTPRNLERLPVHVSRTLDLPIDPDAEHAVEPAAALSAAREVLRRRRFRLGEYADEPAANGSAGGSIAAEKGHTGETGNLAFHLALLGLLVAVAVGSFLSYRGQIVVTEGEPFANVRLRYATFEAGSRVDVGRLQPFVATLDSLDVTFDDTAAGNQFGAPRSFVGRLTVTDAPGVAPRTVDLRVNEPLDVRGTRVFLVGNGYAPVVTVRDGEGRVAFTGPVPFLPQDSTYASLGVIKAPDAKPAQIGLTGLFLPTAKLDPRRGPISLFPGPVDPKLVLTAWVSRPGQDGLGLNDGVPQSVYVLDTTNLTQVRTADGEVFRLLLGPGSTVTLPDGAGTVTFEGLRRFAALDVRYDPTKLWALGFALVALTGVTASLFVRRRRLWARVSTDARGRTVVQVAGLARGDDVGLAPLAAQVLDEIVRRCRPADRPGGPPAGTTQKE